MGFGDHQRGSGSRPGEGAGRNPRERTGSGSPVGKPIANPEKFIYPMESVQLPAGAKPEGDLWTIIHNTHNIK